MTSWLAAEVCETQRRPERVREMLLARCRAEQIEPPGAGRVERIVRSALRTGEKTLALRISSRLAAAIAQRLGALADADADADADDDDELAHIVTATVLLGDPLLDQLALFQCPDARQLSAKQPGKFPSARTGPGIPSSRPGEVSS